VLLLLEGSKKFESRKAKKVSHVATCARFLFGVLTAFSGQAALSPSNAAAATSGITYHGRILNPDGTPLEGSAVQFRFQIRTPDAQSCVMYEEKQVKDMTKSSGVFSVTLNDGTGLRSDDAAYSFDQIFGNRGSFYFSPNTCVSGNGVYNPNSSDRPQNLGLLSQ